MVAHQTVILHLINLQEHGSSLLGKVSRVGIPIAGWPLKEQQKFRKNKNENPYKDTPLPILCTVDFPLVI